MPEVLGTPNESKRKGIQLERVEFGIYTLIDNELFMWMVQGCFIYAGNYKYHVVGGHVTAYSMSVLFYIYTRATRIPVNMKQLY